MFGRKFVLRVVPDAEGHWRIVAGDIEEGRFLRKREATTVGREIVRKRGGGEIVVQSLSGRITERDSVPAP